MQSELRISQAVSGLQAVLKAGLKQVVPTHIRRRAALSFYRRHMVTRWAIFAMTVFLTVLPFWLASSNTVFKEWLSNRAMAASVATVKIGQQIDVMSDKQKARHIKALVTLLPDQPQMIEKLRNEDVILSFSYPNLKRQEGKIEVWQYRSKKCVLDIFFNAESGNGDHVVAYEVRRRGKAYLQQPENTSRKDQPDSAECVRSLMGRG